MKERSSQHLAEILLFGSILILLPISYSLNNYMRENTATFILAISCITSLIVFSIRSKVLVITKVDLLITIYASWYLICMITSTVEVDTKKIIQFLSLLMLYITVRNIRNENHKILSYCLCIGGLVQNCIGLAQYYDWTESNNLYFDLTGSFNNPGILAIYLTIGFIASILWFKETNISINKYLSIICMCLLVYGISLTGCRTTLISFVVCLVYYLCRSSQRIEFARHKRLLSLAIAIFFILLFILLYAIRPASVNGRLLIYIVSWGLFSSSPLCGNGVSSYEARYMPQQGLWFQDNPNSHFILYADNNHHAFNEYIRIACEEGIIGLTFFVLILYYSLNKVQRPISFIQITLLMIASASLASYPLDDLTIISLFCILLSFSASNSKKIFSVSNSGILKSFMLLIAAGFMYFSSSHFHERNKIENYFQKYACNQKNDNYTLPEDDVQQASNSTDFVLHYGRMLFKTGKYIEAIPVLEKANDKYSNALILQDLAFCLNYKGESEAAEKLLIQSHQMIPNRILPLYNLFLLFLEEGRLSSAYKVAEYATKIELKIYSTRGIKARNHMSVFLKRLKERRE